MEGISIHQGKSAFKSTSKNDPPTQNSPSKGKGKAWWQTWCLRRECASFEQRRAKDALKRKAHLIQCGSFNAQWKVEPLKSLPSSAWIAAPNPDLTIGYEESHLTGGSIICRPVPGSAPVICDHRLRYPCITIEVKPNEIPQWLSQNLHNAAVMLRTKRRKECIIFICFIRVVVCTADTRFTDH